jgi:alkylhydroperoxidase family enzyme
VQQVIDDLDAAPIPDNQKALLHFVRKVTHEPYKITRDDMQPLYAHGWDDAAIYYAITVSALFNFYNRWIDSTGVHPVSAENHALHAAKIATRGYVR